MDKVTTRILEELRTNGQNSTDENDYVFAEDSTPLIGVNGSDERIPYADEESVLPPVSGCESPVGAKGSDPATINGIPSMSFKYQPKNLKDDPDGFALLQALVQDNIEEVKRWISWHFWKNTLQKLRYGSDGATALIIVSFRCDLKAINALYNAGVDPNEADWSGRTPLLVASSCGRPECVKELLDIGANPNLGFKKSGAMRISEAVEDNEWRKKEDEFLSGRGIKLPNINVEGQTPLHLAAQANNLDCLNHLLIYKADPNATDNNEYTPLMLAGEGLDAGDVIAVRTYEDIIEKLLGEEGNKEIVKVIGEREMGTTVLHRAAELDAHNALRLLLKSGCDPNRRANELSQLTPLHVAAETAGKSCHSNPSCMSILLSYGANLSAKNDEGLSALEIIVTQVNRPKKFLYAILDDQINLAKEECEKDGEVRVNFNSVSPVNIDHQEKVLHTLLEEECISRWMRYDLFRHPLLKSFVICKWSRLKKFFYVYVVVYLIHVLSLSVFVTLAHCDIFNLFGGAWRNAIMQRGIPISKLFVVLTSILVLINISWMCYVFPHRYPFSFEALRNFAGSVLSIVVSVSTVYDGDSYAFSTRITRAKFLDNREEIESPSASDDVAVLADDSSLEVNYTGKIPILPNRGEDTLTQWNASPEVQLIVIHCTAIAIFQAWLDLMLLVGRFPWASDALLFTAVLKNVLRVLVTYGYMIIGFAFVFFLEFREANIFAFGDPWRALLKTTVMMMGEYDYMNTFAEEEKDSAVLVASKLSIFTQVIFLSFVIIASVALMNLMLGLAVSDTQALAEESSQRQLMKLAESVVHWGTAVCALEKLSSRYPKMKNWFKMCRTIPNELRFPLNFKKSVIPRELMTELLETATKNQDNKQKQERVGQPLKNHITPSKSVSYISKGSTASTTNITTHLPQHPGISVDAKEVIESLRNEIAELRQEVTEIKELLENHFTGEDKYKALPRTYKVDSTRNPRRFGTFLRQTIKNRRGNAESLELVRL